MDEVMFWQMAYLAAVVARSPDPQGEADEALAAYRQLDID